MGIAILLDLDNIKPNLDELEEICRGYKNRYGDVCERRAFANTAAVLTAYGSDFRRHNYRFEITPGIDTVKEEVDVLIIKTAREFIDNPNNNIDTIAIVSNDNGYADLLTEFYNINKSTIIIGNQPGKRLQECATHTVLLQNTLRISYTGIDLGTTNTVIAKANQNLLNKRMVAKEIMVPVQQENQAIIQSSQIPSSVRFELPTPVIGFYVKNEYIAYKDRTILAWKHNMGKLEKGCSVKYNLNKYQQEEYAENNLSNYMKSYESNGSVFPEEAAAAILEFCRDKIDHTSGIVITHPASYETDAIDATRKAAVLAGWKTDDIVLLPEPHAALYDYLDRAKHGEIQHVLDFSMGDSYNIMVYDLGGGTLDVTIHTVVWNDLNQRFDIEDIAMSSRTRVGGDLADSILADYIINENYKLFKDLNNNKQIKLKHELELYAEKFKKVWGAAYNNARNKDRFSYNFRGMFLNNDEDKESINIMQSINVEDMKSILSSLLCPDLSLELLERLDPSTAFDKTPFLDRMNTFVVPVLEVLLKAKQKLQYIPEIDAVLLNGGMTYFPLIRDRINELFKNKVNIITDGNPDYAVARGAALYAAGEQGTGSIRVNPTNIYLEALKNGQDILQLIVSQGQKIPYRTTLEENYRLPDEDFLDFKIWVGMGSKKNNNTTLQRKRRVSLTDFRKKISDHCQYLKLEVFYNYDEKLILTLFDPNDTNVRFESEVTSDHEEEPQEERQTFPIPAVNRIRKHNTPTGPKKDINTFRYVVKQIQQDPSDGALQKRCKDIIKEISHANNRDELAKMLLSELNDSITKTNHIRTTKCLICLREILMNCYQVNEVESLLKTTIRKKIGELIRFYSPMQVQNALITEIGETPGKLLWTDFNDILITACNHYHDNNKKIGISFLNSLGKCAKADEENFEFLIKLINKSREYQYREKAYWAFAKLISPVQPDDFRFKGNPIDVYFKFFLERLTKHEYEIRTIQSLLSCIFQILAWHPIRNNLVDNNTKYIINSLVKNKYKLLPALNQYESKYEAIKRDIVKRIDHLPELLKEWKDVPEEKKSELIDYLLEVHKDDNQKQQNKKTKPKKSDNDSTNNCTNTASNENNMDDSNDTNNHNYCNGPRFCDKCISNWLSLIDRLKHLKNPEDKIIWDLLDDKTKAMINTSASNKEPKKKLKNKITKSFNTILGKKDFYDGKTFEIELCHHGKGLLSKGLNKLSKDEIELFNRLLFEKIFPDEILPISLLPI